MAPASGQSRDATILERDPAVAGYDPYHFLANPFTLASQPRLKQSVFGFAGRTNSGNLGSTFAFGSGAPEPIFFDNFIIGGAYQRDFVHFNSGVLIGAEIGLADRFGNYSLCCDRVVRSNRVAHSAELWGGISFRHEGLALFDTIRISPGFVIGLSAISDPIGQEALHQFDHRGSAKALFYLGFDLAFALGKFTKHGTGNTHSSPFGWLWHPGRPEGRQQRQRRRNTSPLLMAAARAAIICLLESGP